MIKKDTYIQILINYIEKINKDAEFMQSVIDKLEKEDDYIVGKIAGYYEISEILEEIIELIWEEK